jgi:hypothetical protein
LKKAVVRHNQIEENKKTLSSEEHETLLSQWFQQMRSENTPINNQSGKKATEVVQRLKRQF